MNPSSLEKHVEKIPEAGCWIWMRGISSNGYGAACRRGAHRVSFEQNVGPIPAGLQVLHRCDVRCCVNPAHLFLGTQNDNLQDMKRKGRGRVRRNVGVDNPRCKLSTEDVLKIRADARSHSVIARERGISSIHVFRIKNRTAWSGL